MSDQLREAFRDLAADGPDIDATAAASSRTWQRARASRRRSFAAIAAAVVLVLLGGFLAVGLTVSQRPTPAAPPSYDGSKLAIPDQVWVPSPWTPGTDEAGPLGPLALIAEAPRHDSWFHQEDDALFGVSAIDGTYRFIDLPDAVPQDNSLNATYAISPDGQKIGYWTQGRVTAPLRQSEVDGYAVYDTVTGKVKEHRVATRFGLASERSLVWSGDSIWLVASFSRFLADTRQGGGFARGTLPQAWNPKSGDTEPLRDLAGYDIPSSPSPAPGGVMVMNDRGRLGRVSLPFGQVVQTAIGPGGAGNVVVSPEGHQIVYTRGSRTASSPFGTSLEPVNVATQQPNGEWKSRTIETGSPSTQPVAWLDANHILALMWFSSRLHVMARLKAVSLDVRTGQSSEVVRLPSERGLWPAFAVGLADRPFATGEAPERPWDPRVLPGVGLGLVAVALLIGLVRWLLSSGRRRRALRGNGVRL